MRFMMLVKGSPEAEKGELPPPELFAQMERYNEELEKAGILLALDGLHPSSRGARVEFGEKEVAVIKGPFANPDELVEGFWIIKADSLDEAISWAKRAPFGGGTVEVREIQEMEDLPPEILSAVGGS